jgi:hypothetical protein
MSGRAHDDEQVHGRRRVVLELELSTEPIAGSVRVDDTPGHPFAGYTQLIAALDAARIAPPPNAQAKPRTNVHTEQR